MLRFAALDCTHRCQRAPATVTLLSAYMNTSLRSVAAVLVGYLVFAVCSFAAFRLSGQAPHAPAPLPVMLGVIASGVVFAMGGGYVTALLAGRRPLGHSIATAALIAAGAAVSLAATLGREPVWSQVAALTLMAPAVALGGWLRSRSK